MTGKGWIPKEERKRKEREEEEELTSLREIVRTYKTILHGQEVEVKVYTAQKSKTDDIIQPISSPRRK